MAAPNYTRIVPGVPGAVEVIQKPPTSPAAPKLHPFFFKQPVSAVQETHEMRFHAIARQKRCGNTLNPNLNTAFDSLPDVLPYTRQEGRLRRHRVSTPIQATVVCMPSRPDRPKCSARPQLFDADLPDVDNEQVLTIWTPPRVGSALGPRILFPNSPSVVDKSVAFAEIAIQCSSVAAADVAIQCSSETCDSACQTSPRQTSPRLERDSNVQTSPRLSEPVTLLELKKELQALLSGICWL